MRVHGRPPCAFRLPMPGSNFVAARLWNAPVSVELLLRSTEIAFETTVVHRNLWQSRGVSGIEKDLS